MARLGIIHTGLSPGPQEILRELFDLFLKKVSGHSVLLSYLSASLIRLALALAFGTFLGIIIGVFMGYSRRVKRFVDPILTFLMPIPGIAMAPLFIIWMGFGDKTIISLGAIAAFFPIAVYTVTGVRSVDRQLIRAALLMGATQKKIFSQVFLPWSGTCLFTGVKLGLARCWRTIIAVEFIAATSWGLGYMIWDAAEYLRAEIVYGGGIILLAVIFALIEKGLINPLEKKTIEKWGMVQR